MNLSISNICVLVYFIHYRANVMKKIPQTSPFGDFFGVEPSHNRRPRDILGPSSKLGLVESAIIQAY